MVKIFTMVKDEVDIIKEWVIYHGCLFGWNNIYVIDNYSTDGTYEELLKFKDLIHIERQPDYKKKGLYMTELFKKYCTNEEPLGFPIDIDEFICYLEPNSNEVTFDKDLINNYIKNLPESRVYKANYLTVYPNKPGGNNNAVCEIDYAKYDDYGASAKSFINKRYFHDVIDHGNHIHCRDYLMTNIVLVHYHRRNNEQIRKKILNNVIGLGYPDDLNQLKHIIQTTPIIDGCHHIHAYISILENTYQIEYYKNTPGWISIKPLKQRVIDGFF